MFDSSSRVKLSRPKSSSSSLCTHDICVGPFEISLLSHVLCKSLLAVLLRLWCMLHQAIMRPLYPSCQSRSYDQLRPTCTKLRVKGVETPPIPPLQGLNALLFVHVEHDLPTMGIHRYCSCLCAVRMPLNHLIATPLLHLSLALTLFANSLTLPRPNACASEHDCCTHKDPWW